MYHLARGMLRERRPKVARMLEGGEGGAAHPGEAG